MARPRRRVDENRINSFTSKENMPQITCAFCKGSGKDPFNLLSKLADCQVCGGTGKVKVDEPIIECAFCRGSGIHLHSRLSCSACKGKGSVTHKGAKQKCPNCGGTGYKVDGNLPCSVCGGKGVVRKV